MLGLSLVLSKVSFSSFLAAFQLKVFFLLFLYFFLAKRLLNCTSFCLSIFNHFLFLQENKELHEIIMNLRDEKNMKSNEVKELKTALSAAHEGNIELMKGQVLRLTALVTKLERNLNAKQVFCETVVTENDSLKNELQSLRDDRVTRVRDLKRGLGQLSTQPDVRRILNQVYDTPDGEPEVNNQTQVVFKKMMVLSSFLCFVLFSSSFVFV